MNVVEKKALLLEAIQAYFYNEKEEYSLQKERLRHVLYSEITMLLEEKDLKDTIVKEKDHDLFFLLQEGHFFKPLLQILETYKETRPFIFENALQNEEGFFSFIDFMAKEKERTAPLVKELREKEEVRHFAMDCIRKRSPIQKEKDDIEKIKNLLDLNLLDLGLWEEPDKHGVMVPAVCFSFDSKKYSLAKFLYTHESFQAAKKDFQEKANLHILRKLSLRSLTDFNNFLALPGFFPCQDSLEIIEEKYKEKSIEEKDAVVSFLTQQTIINEKHSAREKEEMIYILSQTFKQQQKAKLLLKKSNYS